MLQNNSELQSSIGLKSNCAKFREVAQLIILEEMPIANKAAIECADSLMKSITHNECLFGGKVFLGLGDFHQVAPIVSGTGPISSFQALIRFSFLWPNFQILRLNHPI